MKCLFFILSFLFVQSAFATPMVGAISGGMGGTGRADLQSNESLYLNPATIAMVDRFYAGTSYQTGFLDRDISRNTYGVTMSDGTKGLYFPGSFGYRRHSINQNGERLHENEFRVAFGKKINRRFMVGFGYTHLIGEDSANRRYTQNNGDLGLLYALMPNWALSLTAENLIKPDPNLPPALRRLSQVSLGTQWVNGRMFTLRYEMLRPYHVETEPLLSHRLGASVGLRGDFRWNLGFSADDNLGQNWVTTGVAWQGPRLKFAYSYQQESRAELGDRHLIDLWIDI